MSLRTAQASGATALILLAALIMTSCASLSNRDPLMIDVAGIEPLPGEGLELRLAVRLRIQNPNNDALEYNGAALTLDLNDIELASGVSDSVGTVPRYGETVIEIPVTISAFNMARQVLGFVNTGAANEVRFRVRGKLEGGLFGTRRFEDEGTFNLNLPAE
jgi:hypothetical protein